MADPPPSGSPQESTSPEVRSQQCYVGKVTLLLSQINGGKGGRTRLPVPQPDKVNLNLWSYLKQCIGRELSKITMPVHWNEPLSLLQRITEYMNYSHLLMSAPALDAPLARLQQVATFAVSALASNNMRMGKPFNPLLGETYQLEQDGFRIVCEQVG